MWDLIKREMSMTSYLSRNVLLAIYLSGVVSGITLILGWSYMK